MDVNCNTEMYNIGWGTYPRAIKLQNGTFLGVHTTFAIGNEGQENVIKIKKSTDEGTTWAPIGEVTRGVGDIDNGFLIQLSDGKILCGFRNHSVDASQKNRPFTHYRIMICVSEDCGKEWSYLSTPDESADHSKGLWEPFFRLAKDGTLQLFYSRENRPSDQDSIVRTSHDGGATWGDAIVFGSKATDARDGMLGVAKFGEELVAVFETNECDNGMHIKCVMSSDDGKTWGNRQLVYRAHAGIAAAPQIANCGGVLMVTFQTDEDGTGMCLKILVGQPGCWINKTVVGEGSSVWGGILSLDDKNALVLFDHEGWCKSRKISFS